MDKKKKKKKEEEKKSAKITVSYTKKRGHDSIINLKNSRL